MPKPDFKNVDICNIVIGITSLNCCLKHFTLMKRKKRKDREEYNIENKYSKSKPIIIKK